MSAGMASSAHAHTGVMAKQAAHASNRNQLACAPSAQLTPASRCRARPAAGAETATVVPAAAAGRAAAAAVVAAGAALAAAARCGAEDHGPLQTSVDGGEGQG